METKIDMEKEAQELYINRSTSEKHMTFDQWIKVYQLRNKNTEELKEKYSGGYCQNYPINELKVGDPVKFNVPTGKSQPSVWGLSYEDKTSYGDLQGYIVKINNPNDSWKRSYDISTALGVFENIPYPHKRTIEDLSHIEIPEELSKAPTKRLFGAYKRYLEYKRWYYGRPNYVYFDSKSYEPDVVKAELGKREHVFSKEDKKIMKQYGKKTVNKK